MTKNDDKLVGAAGITFIVLWVIGFLLSLGLTGTIIWGIIELVNWWVETH